MRPGNVIKSHLRGLTLTDGYNSISLADLASNARRLKRAKRRPERVCYTKISKVFRELDSKWAVNYKKMLKKQLFKGKSGEKNILVAKLIIGVVKIDSKKRSIISQQDICSAVKRICMINLGEDRIVGVLKELENSQVIKVNRG